MFQLFTSPTHQHLPLPVAVRKPMAGLFFCVFLCLVCCSCECLWLMCTLRTRSTTSLKLHSVCCASCFCLVLFKLHLVIARATPFFSSLLTIHCCFFCCLDRLCAVQLGKTKRLHGATFSALWRVTWSNMPKATLVSLFVCLFVCLFVVFWFAFTSLH